MLLPLLISTQLQIALKKAKVGFALWKSNSHIEDAISGRTDLDLLINRKDAIKFKNVLFDLRAIKILSQPWASYPNLEDWLVFDMPTGKLLHLHVHYPAGHRPEACQASAIFHGKTPYSVICAIDLSSDWPIPSAEMELLILLVRIWAKMPPWRRLASPKIPSHIARELGMVAARMQIWKN